MTDRTRQDNRQDADRTVLSVADAAARLHVTPDAIRARLHRGTLAGEKINGAWRVILPADQPDARQDTQQDTTGRRPDTDSAPLVAQLRSENDYLRQQLDAALRERTAERERFDVIHRAAIDRIEALTAGEPVDTPTTPPDEDPPPPPWWRFWQR